MVHTVGRSDAPHGLLRGGRARRALAVGVAAAGASAALVFAPFAAPACGSEASPGVELRVLVVAVGPEDPTADAWTTALAAEGVPFDVLRLAAGERVTAAALAGGDGRGRYQAVVLTDNRVAPPGAGPAPPLLTAGERAVLSAYEQQYGVGEVLAATLPAADVPFALPRAPTSLAGAKAVVTPAGEALFPYLAGPVPLDDTAGFVPETADGGTALVTTEDGRILVAERVHPDGRRQLYVFPRVGRTALHWRLLAHGLLTWATRGVHFGTRHFYLAMQVDDVFGVSDRWDPSAHRTVPGQVQMKASDVHRALDWQERQGFVLDLGFNGVEAKGDLCRALLVDRRSFRWFNHTYSHASLDEATRKVIVEEIELNLAWARRQGLEVAVDELVTGNHEGLDNPGMAPSLDRTGVRFIGDDASRSPVQRPIGGALTVPRHPTNVYYDASTIHQQMDEYNQRYFFACPAGAGCLPAPATFEQFLDREAGSVLRHILANDPRVHYAHQANMAGDGTLYRLLDEVLVRFRALVSAPLVQPTLRQSGEELRRQAAWAAAIAAGTVTGMVDGCRLTVRVASDLDVPLTAGTTALPAYAGERTGWITVGAGEHTVDLEPAACGR